MTIGDGSCFPIGETLPGIRKGWCEVIRGNKKTAVEWGQEVEMGSDEIDECRLQVAQSRVIIRATVEDELHTEIIIDLCF